MPIFSKLVTRRMPKHVRMDWEWEFCSFSSPSDRLQESRSRGGATTLGQENVSRFHILAAELTKGADLLAAQRMDVVDAALGSSDMQSAAVEVNLIPTKAAHFRGAQPVAVCDQDHGGIAVPIAGPLAGGLLQPFDLLFRQIFPGPELGIGGSARNCPVYDGLGGGLAGGFCHVIQSWHGHHCP